LEKRGVVLKERPHKAKKKPAKKAPVSKDLRTFTWSTLASMLFSLVCAGWSALFLAMVFGLV
jgi:fatty acid desaturase